MTGYIEVGSTTEWKFYQVSYEIVAHFSKAERQSFGTRYTTLAIL